MVVVITKMIFCEYNLSEYYSENLDALYNCLTKLVCEISILNSNLDEKLLATFIQVEKI